VSEVAKFPSQTCRLRPAAVVGTVFWVAIPFIMPAVWAARVKARTFTLGGVATQTIRGKANGNPAGERGTNVPEVELISGHKTPAMLFRYTHLKAEAVAEKLRLQK
jgi:hypothetical protein